MGGRRYLSNASTLLGAADLPRLNHVTGAKSGKKRGLNFGIVRIEPFSLAAVGCPNGLAQCAVILIPDKIARLRGLDIHCDQKVLEHRLLPFFDEQTRTISMCKTNLRLARCGQLRCSPEHLG